MCNRPLALVLLFVGAAAGCSNSRQMQREDLKSAAAQLQSIAAEGALFAQVVADGNATPEYAAVHPEYLRELADSNAKTLGKSDATPGLQNALDRLRELSRQLEELINSGQAAHAGRQFESIAESADRIRRSL